MSPFRKRVLTEGKRRLLHGLAGFQIMIKALDKYEHGDTGAALALVGIAILFFLYAALHPRLHGKSFAPHLETGAFLAESAVFAITTYTMFHHGKKALPYLYAAVAIMYLFLAWRQHLRNQRGPHEHLAHDPV